MKKLNFLIVAAALGAATAITGCTDEMVQPQTKSSGGELLSRGVYDYPAVEWDNVDGIAVTCQAVPNQKSLPIPWEGGGSRLGVPTSWTDDNLRATDPKSRAYSRENGWQMVFHNLSDSKEHRKFFGLYNKFTGVLRLFFYEMTAGTSLGSSTAFSGMTISGSTSLLNFIGTYGLPISVAKSNPLMVSSPESTISSTGTSSNIGYAPNNWYGMEIEMAYDPNVTSTNRICTRLWGQNEYSINLSGNANGSITGSMQTVYSNIPNLNSFTLSIDASNNQSTTINTNDTNANTVLKNKGGNFINKLWNNIKSGIPDLASKGLSAGFDALFKGGTSLITKGLSKILGGISGRKTSSPMTSTSKIDLGLTSTVTMNGTATANVVGFGMIGDFSLPQYNNSTTLYTGKLGVWNLQDYPNVTVDLLMTSMYYPKELVPNPTRPVACYPTYSYTLSGATVVVNPELLTGYKIENQSQQLVYTANAGIGLGTTASGSEYGLCGNTEYYRPGGALKATGEIMDVFGGNFNPQTSYARYWNGYDKPVAGQGVMCHVYFELVSKTDSNERYAYSKYFPCKAVKGTFSHREETITQ